jgi:phosphomannomutase
MEENQVSEIKFGTDGWRAVIADTFTFKNLKILSQAIAEWVKNDLKPIDGKKRLCIGYDTRFMSMEFAGVVARVLSENGLEILLSDAPIPTPALSYGVPCNKCVAGIMITASHNPYKFNGLKIKTFQGGGAGKDITDKVETYLGKTEVKCGCLTQAKEEKRVIGIWGKSRTRGSRSSWMPCTAAATV